MPTELNAGRSVAVAPSGVREGATDTRSFPLRKGMDNLPKEPMQPVYIDHNPEVPRPAPAGADGASGSPTAAPSTQPSIANADE